MSNERARRFAEYVGLELKGMIASTKGVTANGVARTMGRQPAAFNRWLNGKIEIPLSVACEACEVIETEPKYLVERAYDRMVAELGEADGRPGAVGDDLAWVLEDTKKLRKMRSDGRN